MHSKRSFNFANPTLVSVIVPVWNAETYLHEALESLRSQSFTNIEVIMVDDGSTDASASICREFCDKDFRFRLISQPNAGVSSARNRGIEEAVGEWIAFMDADDVMLPDGIMTLMAAHEASGARIVVGDYCRKMPDSHSPRENGRMTVVSSEEAVIMGLYQKFILNNPWGVLFHRSVFKSLRPLRFRICRYEDLDLFYRAFDRVENICLVDEKVYFYRDTPGSFLNTWSDSRLDVLDVTDRIVEYYSGRDPRLLRAAEDRRFSAHFNMLMEMTHYRVDDPRQMERCKRVIKEYRRAELKDRNVRMKNKIGALLSYLIVR